MNIDRFANPNLKIPSAIGCGLGLAIGLGMWAGSGDFDKLKYMIGGLAAMVFVLFFLRFAWVLALLICFCGFMQIGFGFTIGDLEMSLALAGVVFAVTWWRKERVERPPVLEQWSFSLFNILMLLWLAYVTGHTLFNIYAPYRPADYALRNLLKTVDAWAGPFLLMVYFGARSGAIVVKRNFPKTIAWCLAFALIVNILIRAYQFFTGTFGESVDPTDPFPPENELVIPGLELLPNVYTLRGITPTAMLFCGAMLTTQWFKKQTYGTRRLFYLIMLLSVIGAAMSGGRATLAFVFVLFLAVLALTRQVGLLMLALGSCAFLIAGVNLVPSLVKESPDWVRRSLNVVLIEKDEEISDRIQNSSDWRYHLFRRALDEWQSDPRIYWFGRATYAYGLDDWIAHTIAGEDAMIDTSLRRGATHNMVTDLLVIFGLVGLVLYFCFYFSLLFFLWKLYRSPDVDEVAKAMTLVLFISLFFNFAFAIIGGGNFSATMAWFYVILIAYVKGQYALKEQAARPTIEPPRKTVLTQAPAYPRPALRPSM